MLFGFLPLSFLFFFFNDTATTEIYTLSLHDALPICPAPRRWPGSPRPRRPRSGRAPADRKSTRLNSSHLGISYAVFCLKKKTLSGLGTQPDCQKGRVTSLHNHHGP